MILTKAHWANPERGDRFAHRTTIHTVRLALRGWVIATKEDK